MREGETKRPGYEEAEPESELGETLKVTAKLRAEIRALGNQSAEVLKKYGVIHGLITEDTPLEEVRQKLIAVIDERKTKRRERQQAVSEEHRKLGDSRRKE